MQTINDWIKQTLAVQTASKTLIAISCVITLFHLLIVAQIIPYSIVWGGRLTSYSEMLRFESFSITINLLVIAVAVLAGNALKNRHAVYGILRMVLWGLFFMLFANTIANPFSATAFEAIVFTPVTALMACCLYRLILGNQSTARVQYN